jgi:hypothetical protein
VAKEIYTQHWQFQRIDLNTSRATTNDITSRATVNNDTSSDDDPPYTVSGYMQQYARIRGLGTEFVDDLRRCDLPKDEFKGVGGTALFVLDWSSGHDTDACKFVFRDSLDLDSLDLDRRGRVVARRYDGTSTFLTIEPFYDDEVGGKFVMITIADIDAVVFVPFTGNKAAKVQPENGVVYVGALTSQFYVNRYSLYEEMLLRATASLNAATSTTSRATANDPSSDDDPPYTVSGYMQQYSRNRGLGTEFVDGLRRCDLPKDGFGGVGGTALFVLDWSSGHDTDACKFVFRDSLKLDRPGRVSASRHDGTSTELTVEPFYDDEVGGTFVMVTIADIDAVVFVPVTGNKAAKVQTENGVVYVGALTSQFYVNRYSLYEEMLLRTTASLNAATSTATSRGKPAAATMTGDDSVRDLLGYLQEFSRSNVYTPVMVLAAVTNKKLDTTLEPISDDDALAHTYTAFVRTAALVERLEDASDSDRRYAGLTKRIRQSSYLREFKPRVWHTKLDTTLIAEGTARSSAFVRPAVDYYPDSRRKKVVASSVRRLEAMQALMSGLPSDSVSLEVPNRHVETLDASRDDLSEFYKINSALYVSAFRDVGVMDLAFASQNADGSRTHSVHFNRFAATQWDKGLRLVPYNAHTEEQGAITDSVLAQLEPIPTLRRTDAERVERVGAPDALQRVERLFSASSTESRRASASLQRSPELMPPPPQNIVITLRAEDTTDEVATRVVSAVSNAKQYFSSARVHTHYLTDSPVRGDESSLPPVVLYEVELRLR